MTLFPVKQRIVVRDVSLDFATRPIKRFVEVDDNEGLITLKIKKLRDKGCFNIKRQRPLYGNVRITFLQPR